jgi:hypothetical protein
MDIPQMTGAKIPQIIAFVGIGFLLASALDPAQKAQIYSNESPFPKMTAATVAQNVSKSIQNPYSGQAIYTIRTRHA